MPCYNCASRVLRIFLQDSIAASISRPGPRLQHYYFRQQQQRLSLHTQAPFHIGQRLQSTLATGSAAPPPCDDDYIPFGPPITTTNERILACNDGSLSGLLPPPPPMPVSTPLEASNAVDYYEPEVEILEPPEVGAESQVREAESKRAIELIRRKIEASWARKSALHRSMAETGLPVVGGNMNLQEDARLAVSQGRVTESGSGDDGAWEGSRGVKGRGNWKLPTMKGEAKRQARREAKRWKEEREAEREQRKWASETKGLSSEARRKLKKMERRKEGKWGASKEDLGKPMERRLEFKGDKDESLEVKAGEGRGEVKAQRTVIIGHCQIPVPVVKQSLPQSMKARVSSIRDFIRGEKDPSDKKGFSREGAKRGKSAAKKEQASQRRRLALPGEAEEGFGREQKRKKRKWELPPIEEVKKESKTDEWGARQKLQHLVATTPKSELEPWLVQKAALQKKFGTGWAPLKKLSPKARDWVRELHGSVPELTTEKLSDIFMVSPEAIRRILKSNWTPSPEEQQDRERRWQRRRERIWERWIDTGYVQMKGTKADVRKLKAENREKWLREQDEAYEQYSEKIDKARKEGSAVWNRMGGGVKELFQTKPQPQFSDAGDIMANEVRERRKTVKKWREWDRKYQARFEKATSPEAATDTPEKLPVESLAKLSSRFL